MNTTMTTGAPAITELKVIPVAGRDSMLLNLSGAHGPFFTRNIVILKDSAGNTGLGEVPGGKNIPCGNRGRVGATRLNGSVLECAGRIVAR